MNILHISPYFPALEANHAGGVCMGKHIEALRDKHQVYVLTFVASEFDEKLSMTRNGDFRYKTVKINRWTRMFHIILEPWMPAYFAARSSLRFAVKLIWMVKKYKIQAIHAEYASMGQYMWIKRLYSDLKFNLVEHDMTAQSYERKLQECRGWRKIYYGYQLKRVLKKEKIYCTKADCVFTLNDKDRRLIKEQYGREKCEVLNPFYGMDDALLEGRIETEKKEYANICFLGQMRRDENYLAAMRLIHIAERVKEQIPELQVYIVGNQPPEELKRQENDYIHVTGFVDDVDDYLKRAQLGVFPLELGAGIKLKVLRSMAVGTPVITTMVGAEGIDENGEVVELAETDEEFSEKIKMYLEEPAMLQKKAKESREYVKAHFGWKKSERILEGVYGGQ